MKNLFYFLEKKVFFNLLFLTLFFCLYGCSTAPMKKEPIKSHIQKQLSFGPRTPGSEASFKTANYFRGYLENFGWQIEYQEFIYNNVILRNVIAKNSAEPPQLIIGSHYDTRQFSDEEIDSLKQSIPVPGAIDGGSGSALLLELGRLNADEETSIWLVFFDGEDQGRINKWQWSIGAEYFAQNLTERPKRVVILDMLGDHDLRVFKELNSDQNLSNEIWEIARNSGFSNYFMNEQKHSFIDDHLPFINLGIPTALLIDFDYPFWHTTSDTLDKVSERSLEIVLEIMQNWIESIPSDK